MKREAVSGNIGLGCRFFGSSAAIMIGLLAAGPQTRALFAEGSPTANESKPQEKWFVYRMGGSPVGYISETTFLLKEGKVGTRARSLLVINRLGNKVKISQAATMSESAAGRLSVVESEISMSEQKTELSATVKGKTIELRTRAGGKDYQRTIACPEDIAGPEGIRLLTVRKLRHPGDTAVYHTFMPEFADVREATRELVGTESIDLPSGKVKSLKVEEKIAGYPVKRTIWLDVEGRLVKHAENGPFGMVEVIRSPREIALQSAASKSLPAEMFDQTLIRSNVRLPSPRALERIVLRLSPKNVELGIPNFAEGNQRLLRRDGDVQIIEIRRTPTKPLRSIRPLDADLRPYLSANALVQSDDPEIIRIAKLATAGKADPMDCAKALETWVNQNMHFDLGVAVAPASEIVRNRRGTCCAYATLLTALCRARGIPGRVAMGLVYTSGIWGGHFWTEALIGNDWVALDAAISSASTADPARIAGKRSSLADGVGPDTGTLWQMFTNLNVRVVEYQLAGRTISVPENAPSYSVQDDVYRNTWLGISITKPAGFRFTSLDAVYPDSTVVGIDGPKGEKARLRLVEGRGDAPDWKTHAREELRRIGVHGDEAESTIAGRDALQITAPDKAALATFARNDLWLLTVDGVHARELLQELNGRIEWPR